MADPYQHSVYMLVIGLEILLSHLQQKASYTMKDTMQNIYLMLANAGIDLVVPRHLYRHHTYLFLQAPVCMKYDSGWMYWLWLFIAEDFMYYWLHRVDHHVPAVLGDACNPSFFRKIQFYRWLPLFGYGTAVPVYLFYPPRAVGFKPLDIAFVYAATQIWGILVHTEKINKLGWLEYILVTPSHHRVHHASNPKYLDKNMGMFLIIWDKLFGTFQPELADDRLPAGQIRSHNKPRQ